VVADGLVIRPARPHDALSLRALGMQVFLETYAPHGIDAAMAREVHAEFALDDVQRLLETAGLRLFMAERDGRAIGFAQLATGSACPIGRVAASTEVQRLYVQAASKGTGAGKALLRHCELQAREQGDCALWLRAWAGNGPAREFYARQGYADVGATEYVFEDRSFENRVFVKSLQP
jgi:diamine N-acetyltransferase